MYNMLYVYGHNVMYPIIFVLEIQNYLTAKLSSQQIPCADNSHCPTLCVLQQQLRLIFFCDPSAVYIFE